MSKLLTIRVRVIALLAVCGAISAPLIAAAQSVGPFVPGRLLVKFKASATEAQVRGLLQSTGARQVGAIPRVDVRVLQLPARASEKALERAFAQRREVAFAAVDRIYSPQDVTPNDPYFANWEWHLKKIQCPAAWSSCTGSPNVVIAILDTGCDATHPDLAPKIVPGWNVYDNNADTADVYGHGTQVAGVAAAASNNGAGVASVAWGCKIMPVRVSDATGGGYASCMASGLTWAADHGARVANISYSVTNDPIVDSAAQYFRSKGGVVTVSAGNDGGVNPAADDPYVLTVTATNTLDQLYTWSTTGSNVDVCAPGEAWTTIRGGKYNTVAGTSVAAPIVAGIAALVVSVHPNLTASQVDDVLKRSADDLGAPGWDASFGWGRVNAARAVAAAGGATPPPDTTPPTVSITSPAAGATVTGTVQVQVAASDNVGVSSVALYVDGALVGTDAAEPYAFAWRSASVANGSHTLKAVATDASGNTAAAQLTVTVSNQTDISPPVVSILSPASSGPVGNPLAVTASATDNVGVTRVELYVDGKLVGTDTASPYSFSVNTRKWGRGSSHTLLCRACDAAGNVGSSPTVTVFK